MVLLFQWMTHVHAIHKLLLTRAFMIAAVVFLLFLIAAVVATVISLNSHSDVFFQYSGGLYFGLYSTMYVISCLLCASLLYYGVRVQQLLRGDDSASRNLLGQGEIR
jgi:hypothetical protein